MKLDFFFFLNKSKLLCFKELEIGKKTGKYCSEDISLPYSLDLASDTYPSGML